MHRERPSDRDSRDLGFVLTEVIVAAIVLVAVVSVVTQLAVRSGRLRMDARHYQVATEELSNQLDRLLVLEESSRGEELKNLTPSPHAQNALSSPELTGAILDDADGRRIVLSLTWDRFGKREPVTLVGWLPPQDPEDPTP
jgi:hypothetical protein